MTSHAVRLPVQIFRKGKCCYQTPDIREIQRYCHEQVATLWDEGTSFRKPRIDIMSIFPSRFGILKTNSLRRRVLPLTQERSKCYDIFSHFELIGNTPVVRLSGFERAYGLQAIVAAKAGGFQSIGFRQRPHCTRDVGTGHCKWRIYVQACVLWSPHPAIPASALRMSQKNTDIQVY